MGLLFTASRRNLPDKAWGWVSPQAIFRRNMHPLPKPFCDDPLFYAHNPVYEVDYENGDRSWMVVDLFGWLIPEGEA